MSTGLHLILERNSDNLGWVRNEENLFPYTYQGGVLENYPFDFGYEVFGFLAGVRDTEITPIAEPRGLPEDLKPRMEGDYLDGKVWLGEHSHSFLMRDELLSYDYSQPVVEPPSEHWELTPQIGIPPRVVMYLGPGFMSHLEILRNLKGDWRIVFGFDC